MLIKGYLSTDWILPLILFGTASTIKEEYGISREP
jgi:hypothetical protein